MNALRRLKPTFQVHSVESLVNNRQNNPASHSDEFEQKRNLWRFRKPKPDEKSEENPEGVRFKKPRSSVGRREEPEDAEEGSSGGEGEHADPPDELEREMENETDVDVDVDKEGVSFKMKETRRSHLKMVRQRHKQESHAGS